MGSEISKKDITRLGFRSSLLQASFNYERMQAGGFTWAMLPILKKIYKDDKPGLSAAMKDNLEFINTHPNLVGFLMGLLISMEDWRCDFLVYLVTNYGGDLLIVCQSGKPAGADSVLCRLPAYLFLARRLDSHRLLGRREGY